MGKLCMWLCMMCTQRHRAVISTHSKVKHRILLYCILTAIQSSEAQMSWDGLEWTEIANSSGGLEEFSSKNFGMLLLVLEALHGTVPLWHHYIRQKEPTKFMFNVYSNCLMYIWTVINDQDHVCLQHKNIYLFSVERVHPCFPKCKGLPEWQNVLQGTLKKQKCTTLMHDCLAH